MEQAPDEPTPQPAHGLPSLLNRALQHPIAPVWAAFGWVVVFLVLRGDKEIGRLLPAVVVTGAFALSAWLLRAVDTLGALTGAAVAFLCYAVLGLPGFAILLFVFVLTWAVTLFGRNRKQALGTAESSRGRTSFQVWANLHATGALLALAGVARDPAWLIAGAIAALAEVAADTTSSELGQAMSKDARLITTFEKVLPGTDGGISVAGSIAGIAAAVATAALASQVGILDLRAAGIVAGAAMAGVVLDSVVGATWERAGRMNNNAVNTWSTAFAAFAATIAVALSP